MNLLWTTRSAALVLVCTLSAFAIAQPPFGQGTPQPGFGGGPPGGGDRGSRGGPPGGGSSDRGGPPGGGDRGGFDPAAMLSRLDANGNGSIDPDEMQGPARFMLDRMGRDNPEIAAAMAASKPISLSKITKTIEKMRGERSDSGGSSNGNSSPGSSSSTSKPKEPEPLVPGFGSKKEQSPILGFGVDGSQAAAVKIEESDLKEAAERMQRYDTNKDGILDEKEIKDGRWSDNPLQFDRNGDKKLTTQELAVRYAKRRMAELAEKSGKQASSSSNRNDRRRDGESRSKDQELPVSPWSKQASYKVAPRSGSTAKVQGLPEWFASSDANHDGQVMMHEFASNWDDATLKEFGRFDTNGDGTITTLETLAAVKKGVLRGSSPASSSGSSSGPTVSSGSVAISSPTAPSAPVAVIDRSDIPADADKRWVDFAALQIKKSDKDNNGRLTPDEWSASAGDFGAVDKNGDGSISLGEVYNFRKKK